MQKASKMGDSSKRDDVLKRLLHTKPSKHQTKKERISERLKRAERLAAKKKAVS